MTSHDDRSNATMWPFVSPDTTISTEATNEILSQLMGSHLSRLTPDGWEAAGRHITDCIRGNSLSSLCLYDPAILDLTAADQFHIRQCLAFFSKRVDIDIGVDREATAYRKFTDSEAACKLTNECFRGLEGGRFQFLPRVDAIIHGAQRKISKFLETISVKHGWLDQNGDPRAPMLSEIEVRFGPGGSSQVPKRKACPAVKLKQAPACSANMFPWAKEAFIGLPQFWDDEYGVDFDIHDAVLSFVDKNAKTKRAICTEPQLNSMFQLGLGEVIADALLSVGVDIHDQGPNQRAALYGSLSGYSATLDLQSASDTVALLLVRHLFPEGWYDLFCTLRSESVVYCKDGVNTRIVLSKISSMGNGFTFPLETLIFWAFACAASDRCANPRKQRVLVYGDDIIVPVASYELLCDVLRAVGFIPNPTKSFATGSFRESCGHDYVFGINVRPLYVSDVLSTLDVFRMYNFYYRLNDYQACRYLEGLLSPPIVLRGPKDYGDGHLHTAHWAAKPVGRDKGWSGFHFESWLSKAEVLDEVSIRRYAGLPIKDAASRKKFTKLHWGSGRRSASATIYRRCIRISTYAVMLNHQKTSFGEHLLYSKAQRYFDRRVDEHRAVAKQYGQPRQKTDLDAFVVPGAEWVKKTLIYVLEPPYTII